MDTSDDIDLIEFNKLAEKYDIGTNAKLERNNELILEIFTMQIPDIKSLDDIIERQNKNIKEQEDYLEEHNQFLVDTMNYCRYISNMRKQVDARLSLIDKKTRKRFDPKIDSVFEEQMNIKKQFDEIPKIKEQMLIEHKQTIASINNEKEVMKGKVRDFYHNEKDLLNEIATKDTELDELDNEIENIKKNISECRKLEVEIANVINQQIPAFEREIAAVDDEIQRVIASYTDVDQKYDDLKAVLDPIIEQVADLDNEYENGCAKLGEIEAKIEAHADKHTFTEIEADGRFDDIVTSDYYQDEKAKYMQFMVDRIEITSDLKNFQKTVAENKAKIESLNAEIEALNIDERRSQLVTDMSKLLDDEVEVTDEYRLLKAQLEAGIKAKQKEIFDLESEAFTLENQKQNIERRMEPKLVELKRKIDAELKKKKQQKPIFSGRLNKKKSAPIETQEEESPPKKPKLDPKATAPKKLEKKATPPKEVDDKTFDCLVASKSPSKVTTRRGPTKRTYEAPKPAEEASSTSSIESNPPDIPSSRATSKVPDTQTSDAPQRYNYKPYFLETESSATDISMDNDY